MDVLNVASTEIYTNLALMMNFIFLHAFYLKFTINANHGLRGSDSTVLMATG